jgi:hypothetical protein
MAAAYVMLYHYVWSSGLRGNTSAFGWLKGRFRSLRVSDVTRFAWVPDLN